MASNEIRPASVGSISSGTLRVEDMLDAFAYELEHQLSRNSEALCADEVGRTIRDKGTALILEARDVDPDAEPDAALEIIADLQDALQVFAPPYCDFGAHPGDGADFGFWPSMEAIEDLPRISDPGDAVGMGEDCAFVNDHGNVTVYDANGRVVLELV